MLHYRIFLEDSYIAPLSQISCLLNSLVLFLELLYFGFEQPVL